ncbi:MAG: NAD(P)H-hydrate dehydratase [bacterium]
MMKEKDYQQLLPLRSLYAHKGDCGRVGLVAGSRSMLGAAILASKAALRAGAGLVYLMTLPDVSAEIQAQCPELIVLPLLVSDAGFLLPESAPMIRDYIQEYRFDAFGMGPGLGRSEDTYGLLTAVSSYWKEFSFCTLLDADALYCLDIVLLRQALGQRFILTPHVGEFRRLFSEEADIVFDSHIRQERCQFWAADVDQVLVLKGANTVVSDGKRTQKNRTGGPALATAGTGDVLSGIILALLAQGMLFYEAACLGVYLHGLAGDLVSEEKGPCLIASDVSDMLPKAWMKLSSL